MSRNSEGETHFSTSRSLRLQVLNKLSVPIFTGVHIKGENGTSIEVALIDCLTGHVVNSGPEASGKVEIVVLVGDFDNGEGNNWSLEEFSHKIVTGKEGRSLLTGDEFLHLKDGLGSIGDVAFAHKAKWMKTREFRLGARMVDDFLRTRVREAKTDSFIVKDRRKKLREKHYPPSLSSEVWRLKNISKYGPLRDRLDNKKIMTVEDFLTHFLRDPPGLEKLLGIPTKKWKETVDHARTCELDTRLYSYPPLTPQQKTSVVFNIAGQVKRLYSEGRYIPSSELSETDKDYAYNLVVSAVKHWTDVVSLDGTSFPNCTSHLSTEVGPSDPPMQDGPKGNNVGSSHIIDGNDRPQPSTSSSDIVMLSTSFSDIVIEGMEFKYDRSSFPSQVFSNSPSFNLELVMLEIDEYMQKHPDNNREPPSTESIARKRWKRLLRWVSKSKNVPSESLHVQKRQRAF